MTEPKATSPGRRALEAMRKERIHVVVTGISMLHSMSDDDFETHLTAIIERETRCDRPHIDELDSSNLCRKRYEELRQKADALAKALDYLLSDSQHIEHECIEEDCPVALARSALAAYKEKNEK